METQTIEELYANAVSLLKELIRTPSLSGEEEGTATALETFLREHGVEPRRLYNNIWSVGKGFDPNKPTILLNSHHDTVPASSGYTRPAHEPYEENGLLYGLGSNDAGGPLVSLIATFLHFYNREDFPVNIVLAATGEEENSGPKGVAALLPVLADEIGDIALGIVGEPTSMEMAVAEKGLIVLECTAHGESGHAAHDEGVNAIYEAMEDIHWFRTYRFPRVSETLGPIKMTVTMIQSGARHNVVPDRCRFTVDVRMTDAYSNAEALEIIRQHVRCDVQPRSLRLNPSGISKDHPAVLAARDLAIPTYGSPTLSDQAHMPFPTIKIGPGDTTRSHTADEYIGLNELREGIATYIALVERLAALMVE